MNERLLTETEFGFLILHLKFFFMPNKTNYLLIVAYFAILSSCQNNNQTKPFLLSSNKDSLITGVDMLTENDTDGVRLIFVNVNDPRITHSAKHYGQSVYQIKMNAMKRISGVEPPQRITREPNNEIVGFYRMWAVKSGYLNDN